MIGIAIAKGVVGVAVSSGVVTVVKSAANTLTIEGINRVQKACVGVAVVVVADMIGKKAMKHADEQIDIVVKGAKSIKALIDLKKDEK